MEKINLDKIESFFNDQAAYKEMLENSETYNTRLCIERRLRLPFIDLQTGVAQNNCALYMKCRQRMPGFREGQMYTYPSARWRKSRRQYLIQRPFRSMKEPEEAVLSNLEFGLGLGASGSENPALGIVDTDSKDSSSHHHHHQLKDEVSKSDWYYDEMDLHDMDGFDDQDPDSDFEEPYSMRKSKGKKGRHDGNDRSAGSSGGGGAGGGGGGGGGTSGPGRRKGSSLLGTGGSDTPKKPGARRGRKKNVDGGGDSPMHSSSSKKSSRTSMQMHDDHSNSSFIMQMDTTPSQSPQHHAPSLQQNAPSSRFQHMDHFSSSASDSLAQMPPTSVMHSAQAVPSTTTASGLATAGADSDRPGTGAAATAGGAAAALEPDHSRRSREKGKVAPSPYCDFCLGDARENKKTGTAEELVSCSDCGRSGHPTCLQFTANMMISVKRYRWQCIECKYCSICGTSDNDDQLLFCDDCDRGYHMYCLSPALTAPPEGSWSCKLCIEEFHTPKTSSTQQPPSLVVAKPLNSSMAASNSIISQQLQQPPASAMPSQSAAPQMPFVTTNTSTPIPTTIINNPMHGLHHGSGPPHPLMHGPHPSASGHMMPPHHPGIHPQHGQAPHPPPQVAVQQHLSAPSQQQPQPPPPPSLPPPAAPPSSSSSHH